MNLDFSGLVRDWIKSQWLNFRRAFIEPQATEELLRGAQVEFYKPGTTERITVFADADLAVAHPSTIVADSRGAFPEVFVADPSEQIAMRLTDLKGQVIMSTEDARPFLGGRCPHCGQRTSHNTEVRRD